MNINQKMENVGAIMSLGFTVRQAWIINHCVEYEFLYYEDIKDKRFSRDIIRRLVKGGHLDKHEPFENDPTMYDLSDECHKRVMGVIKNV